MEQEWDLQQQRKKKKLQDAIAAFGDGKLRVIIQYRQNVIFKNSIANEIDADVEELEKKINEEGDDDEQDYTVKDENEEADVLPFACFICRGPFVSPVVTLCRHYFCSECANRHHRENSDSRCKVCLKQTFGVFNRATKLIKKLAAAAAESEGDSAVTNTSMRVKLGASGGSWEEVQ